MNKSNTPGESEDSTMYEQVETANQKPEIIIVKPENKQIQPHNRAKEVG